MITSGEQIRAALLEGVLHLAPHGREMPVRQVVQVDGQVGGRQKRPGRLLRFQLTLGVPVNTTYRTFRAGWLSARVRSVPPAPISMSSG